MRTTINHIAPADMQPAPADNTERHVGRQIHNWACDAFSELPGRGLLIHTQSAMEIAAWWQSPGPHGIGMAQFASTGTVTDALLDDIERESRAAADTRGSAYVTALAALDAYVRACTVPVWAVGSNTAGYLPEGDVSVFLDYADAVDYFRTEVEQAPDNMTDDPGDGGDCSADGPCRTAAQTPSGAFNDPKAPCCDRDTADCDCPEIDEQCEYHALSAEVAAYLADDVPWTITPSVFAVNPHQGEPRELSIALRPDSRPLPTVYWLQRSERTVADYIREREGN